MESYGSRATLSFKSDCFRSDPPDEYSIVIFPGIYDDLTCERVLPADSMSASTRASEIQSLCLSSRSNGPQNPWRGDLFSGRVNPNHEPESVKKLWHLSSLGGV